MPWVVERSKEIAFKDKSFTINVTNTRDNLLFEVYEHFFGRIFFGVDYWPALKEAIKNILVGIKKGSTAFQEVPVRKGQKNVKLVVSCDKRKFDKIIISRMKSDTAGLTWLLDKETASRGSRYRRIRIPVEKGGIRKLIAAIDKFHEMIEKGEIRRPGIGGIYYPEEMGKHDRSMLAFKEYLDDREFHFFIRLDENRKNSKEPLKIARAKVAKEAKKAGINFLPEKRYDDGFIRYLNENTCVDWEMRRDWAENYNNIPIRFVQRKSCYHAVEYPPPEPGELEPLTPDFDSMKQLKNFMKKKKFRHEKPYFIFRTLGQFARKMKKPGIMLSIQCTQTSPQWPKARKTPTGAYFVAAWHEDFREAGTVIRTTGSGAGELGKYWESDNYGMFEFNKKGVELFKRILKKQYSGGTIEDRNGNTIPQNRQWV